MFLLSVLHYELLFSIASEPITIDQQGPTNPAAPAE